VQLRAIGARSRRRQPAEEHLRPGRPAGRQRSRDQLVHAHTPPTATAPWSNRKLTGFGPFVTTRGGAYCYLPSITALRVLGAT